jgi:hypothetical protein
MSDPLDPLLVHDRDSFLAFVRALADDHRVCAPYGRMAFVGTPPWGGLWHNLTVSEFLDAGVDWVESFGQEDTDFPGTDADFPPEPTWRALAKFLFMCKSRYPGRDTQS